MTGANPPMLVRLRATRTIDAGYVRIEAGESADFHLDDAPALLNCGAAELSDDDAGGEGRAVANPGGSVPQPPEAGLTTPASTATAVAGDETLPGAAPGDGGAATDAPPVSDDTLPGGATPDSAGASPVGAAEGGVAPEAAGEVAAGEVPGGTAPAAAAPRRGRRA